MPFPRSRQGQNFIHYDTTLLPRYYTVHEGDFEYDFHTVGSPGTVLVEIPCLIPFATRSIRPRSRVHNFPSYRKADNAKHP